MLLGYSLYCFGNKLLVINLEAMTETFALFTASSPGPRRKDLTIDTFVNFDD